MTNTTNNRDGRKKVPQQARARATYDKLLRVTGELLESVGVERISTNLIVEHAGVTPPAFYRYFSDKYDVLRTLGEQLMDAQNGAIEQTAVLEVETFRFTQSQYRALLLETVRITEEFPGGRWITRALRAVPQLAPIRLESHAAMTNFIVDRAVNSGDHGMSREELTAITRLTTELGYAAIEYVFENEGCDPEMVMAETSKAIAHISPFIIPDDPSAEETPLRADMEGTQGA